MADNVAITAGAGTTIATDDVSTVHYQQVKLVDGTLNSTTVVPATAEGLGVVPRVKQSRIAVNSSGLTIATTAYTAGDQVGAQLTFANAARVSGGTGTIVGATLLDKNDIILSYDLVITRSSIGLAADNAAYAITDTDAEAIIGIIQFNGALDIGNNRFSSAMGLAIPYDCAATDLFGGLITRVGHTFFTAATDLRVTLYVVQD